jgi:hypothetical protein
MKTQAVGIYHCISCGRVEHAVLEAEPPQCCGQTMAKACAETILEDDVAGEKSAGKSESVPPMTEGRKKPR